MDSKSSHIRSISLPSRSHPTTVRIEEVLNKIKSSPSSSSSSSDSASICENLCRLAELYQCMDEALNMPSTIKALSRQRLGEEFLDSSLRILDICGIAREMVSQFKETVRDLQSCLRRRNGDSSMESSFNAYTSFRTKMKKDTKRSISALKQMDMGSNGVLNLDDHHVAAVVRVLREINTHSTSVFHSVLVFLNAHSSKPSKWSLVSKLVNKGKVGCENQQESHNELEIVDSAVHSLCKKDQSESEKIQFVRKRLEILEAGINVVEIELEGLFRCLMRSRTSILNVFSC